MKKFLSISGWSAWIAVLILALPLSYVIAQYEPDPIDQSFCQHGSYGYNVFSSASTYHNYDAVYFCLQDDTRIPLLIGRLEHPWVITNEAGEVIYKPLSLSPINPPSPTFTFFDKWNRRTNAGLRAQPGIYHIVFPGYVNSPSVTIILEK